MNKLVVLCLFLIITLLSCATQPPAPSQSAPVVNANTDTPGQVQPPVTEYPTERPTETSIPPTETSIPPTEGPAVDEWERIGGAAGAVYAGGDEIFATNPGTGAIYRYTGDPANWPKIGNAAAAFAVNGHGELFAIASDGGSIWQWSGTGDTWDQIGGPAGAIYAGGDELFATNPGSGAIHRYTGDPANWPKIGNAALDFAVTDANELFAIALDGGSVWRWSGTGDTWGQVGGPAAGLYAGGGELFATDPNTGAIIRYDGSVPNWTKVGNAALAFAINESDELFAIALDGNSIWKWKWTNAPDEWEQVGGPAGSIVGTDTGVCAIDPDTQEVYCLR